MTTPLCAAVPEVCAADEQEVDTSIRVADNEESVHVAMDSDEYTSEDDVEESTETSTYLT